MYRGDLMIEMELLDNNLENITYTFSNFTIVAKENLLSSYPNMSAVNHWHEDFEFIVVKKGKMNFSVNGNSYELKENQAIFINSKQMHYGYSADGSDCTFICILLPPSLLSGIDLIKKSYLMPVYNDKSHPFFIFDSSVIWQKNFIDMLVDIYNLCNEERDGFELQVMSTLYSICHVLYHNVINDQVYKKDNIDKNLETMHNMTGYIQQNYQNKITLSDIALAGNICRSNCCKIFQSLLNKSPISYLTEYRLEKSIELLNNPSYSITEIALKCGFNSSSYFTEIFSKNIGCTPSEYRKKDR